MMTAKCACSTAREPSEKTGELVRWLVEQEKASTLRQFCTMGKREGEETREKTNKCHIQYPDMRSEPSALTAVVTSDCSNHYTTYP